jgi:metal-sulfur cluster biosynthetic enzyme
MISNELKTIYDPGIPVNIVDLDLIYASKIVPRSRIRKRD